jgi:hypothetical protein
MSYGVIPQLRASLQNRRGKRVNLFSPPLRAREGAAGQAVVCPLLRGSSPTRGVAPKQHRDSTSTRARGAPPRVEPPVSYGVSAQGRSRSRLARGPGRATGAFGGTEHFIIASDSKGAGQLHATNMPDSQRLGALYSVKKMKNLMRNSGGIRVPPYLQPLKNGMAGYRLGVEWLTMAIANP